MTCFYYNADPPDDFAKDGIPPAFTRRFIKLRSDEPQSPEAPEGYKMENDSEFRERIKAERIRAYADKLDEQPCVQPTMKMVIVAMMRHVADAIEGRDPPPWKEIRPS